MELAVIAKVNKRTRPDDGTYSHSVPGSYYRVVDIDTQKYLDVAEDVIVKSIMAGNKIHGVDGYDIKNQVNFSLRLNKTSRDCQFAVLDVCDGVTEKCHGAHFIAIKVNNNRVVLSSIIGSIFEIPLCSLVGFYSYENVANMQVQRSNDEIRIETIDSINVTNKMILHKSDEPIINGKLSILPVEYTLNHGYAKGYSVVNGGHIVLTPGCFGVAVSGFERTKINGFTSCDSAIMIADCAFWECQKLKHVKLNEGLRIIGMCSFEYTGIEVLNIPSTVKEIMYNAFCGCKGLRTVKLKEGLRYIDEGAFSYTGIEEITLPNSLEEVGEGAFYSCNNLKRVLCKGKEPRNIYRAVGRSVEVHII